MNKVQMLRGEMFSCLVPEAEALAEAPSDTLVATSKTIITQNHLLFNVKPTSEPPSHSSPTEQFHHLYIRFDILSYRSIQRMNTAPPAQRMQLVEQSP
jgi:hypothetical protein